MPSGPPYAQQVREAQQAESAKRTRKIVNQNITLTPEQAAAAKKERSR